MSGNIELAIDSVLPGENLISLYDGLAMKNHTGKVSRSRSTTSKPQKNAYANDYVSPGTCRCGGTPLPAMFDFMRMVAPY